MQPFYTVKLKVKENLDLGHF